MKRNMLDILVCTECKGSLEMTGIQTVDDSGDIISGVLTCTKCACQYPVAHGTPNMLPQ